MLDLSAILNISDGDLDAPQMGLTGRQYAALKVRGFVNKDGKEADPSVKKQNRKDSQIKGDVKLSDVEGKTQIDPVANDKYIEVTLSGRRQAVVDDKLFPRQKMTVLEDYGNGLVLHNSPYGQGYTISEKKSGLKVAERRDRQDADKTALQLQKMDFSKGVKDRNIQKIANYFDPESEDKQTKSVGYQDRQQAMKKRKRKLKLNEEKQARINSQKNARQANRLTEEALSKRIPLDKALQDVDDRNIATNLRRRLEVVENEKKITHTDFERALNAVGGSEKYRESIKSGLKKAGVKVLEDPKNAAKKEISNLKTLGAGDRREALKKFATKHGISVDDAYSIYRSNA